MKLQDIFEQLSVGEFSQLSIGGADAGLINSSNYAKVIPHINLGLTTLYTRFALKEGRVKIRLIDGQTVYPLRSEHSIHSTYGTVESRFIRDSTAARFRDDILKIERVRTVVAIDQEPVEFGLNDASSIYSLFTPNEHTLRLPLRMVTDGAEWPEELQSNDLEITYRANHTIIPTTSVMCSPSSIRVELPMSHLQALLFFVASRAHNPVGMSNEFHAGNSYFVKYEAACQELEGKGIQADQGESNSRLRRGGWV